MAAPRKLPEIRDGRNDSGEIRGMKKNRIGEYNEEETNEEIIKKSEIEK